MSPLFFTLCPVKTPLGGTGTAVCIDLDMEESRLYGIGNLIWRSGITISSKLLTIGRQWNSTRRTNLRYGRKRTGKTGKRASWTPRKRETTRKTTKHTEKARNSEKLILMTRVTARMMLGPKTMTPKMVTSMGNQIRISFASDPENGLLYIILLLFFCF